MKYLVKVTEALKIMLRSHTSPFFLLKRAGSVSSIQIAHSFKQLVRGDIDTLIDVGANQGQFALSWKKFNPKSKVFCFEPVPETFRQLKINTSNYKDIHVFNLGLGSTSGKLTIHKNGHSHASSFLRVSTFQKVHIPKTSFEKLEEVDVSTLDEMCSTFEPLGKSVLKLDVQGFEKEVLSGGGTLLKHIDYLIIEMSFQPMYEGEMLFDEMNDFLKRLGFEIYAPLGFLQMNNLQIPQIDFLFRRNSESLNAFEVIEND
jgi:FkbM family methyltransferase